MQLSYPRAACDAEGWGTNDKNGDKRGELIDCRVLVTWQD